MDDDELFFMLNVLKFGIMYTYLTLCDDWNMFQKVKLLEITFVQDAITI